MHSIVIIFVATASSSPQTSVHSTKHMGPILETAMQRAPLIHLQAGNIQAAIECYR